MPGGIHPGPTHGTGMVLAQRRGQCNVHQSREGEWAEVCRLSPFKVNSGFQLISSVFLAKIMGTTEQPLSRRQRPNPC